MMPTMISAGTPYSASARARVLRVRSGSTLLTEGVDYQVFYDQAKVKILNPAYLNSANELRVEFEKNALVQVQPRRMVGVRLDYKLNNDVTLGGTALSLLERQAPGINRVNIGDEPGNNTIVGLDGSIRKDSRVLTKYLDMLPFVSTKEISTIAFSGEFAKLLPGRSQLGNGENGVSYIDDFENARTPYTLADDDALRALPVSDGFPGSTRSAFWPNGIVPGTERGERLLFWPMGIDSPGAMRQWGRQPTAFVGRMHFDDARLIEERFELKAP